MDARLGGEQGDIARRYVRHVGEEYVDASAQGAGQGGEEVALVDPAQAADVAPGAAHRRGLHIGGVELDVVQQGGECGAERPRAAAEVDHDGPARRQFRGLADQELGAAAGDEDPGVHGDAQTAELGPAEDVFQRVTGDTAFHHGGEFGGPGRGGGDQVRLVLGEYAAGGAEGGDEGGESER